MRSTLWIFAVLLTSLWGLTPLEPTAKMIAVALSIFVVVKSQSLIDFLSHGGRASVWERVGWFVAWPGLNPERFFGVTQAVARPEFFDWALATVKTLLGIGLLLIAGPYLVKTKPLLSGWVTMVGIVMLLHFGLFHFLALTWRMNGRNVEPLMNSPVAATSLSEFWSRRWNIPFRDFAHRFVFRPVTKQWNGKVATWVGFLFSGVIHELAISVPSGAGYGLPLAYFLLQGIGVTIERWATRQGLLVRGGILGWLFTAMFVVPAAYFLFHRPFVDRVILPLID